MLAIVPRHEQNRSFASGNFHLFAPPVVRTPFWATHERLTGCAPDTIVRPECCRCKMRADETVVSIHHAPNPPLGLSDGEKLEWAYGNGACFYDAHQEIRCAEGYGCTINKRRRSSRHLRDYDYF